MIKKFLEIKHMAVFEDFHWDSSVIDKQGNLLELKQINIIYGQNYSGKTTLSRIVRAFETGQLSDKYGNISFKLQLDSGEVLTENNFSQKGILTRVYNEDFVKENLQFINNQESNIKAFAVLGEKNVKIERDIENIRSKLGINNNSSSTGLYKKKFDLDNEYNEIKLELKTSKGKLEDKLHKKATDRETGIKYNLKCFGEQNYNVSDLKRDITKVISNGYTIPSSDEISKFENIIEEEEINDAKEMKRFQCCLPEFIIKCRELCERKIGTSEKIEELSRNVALEDWVRQGLTLNNNRKYCAFCGQKISDDRKKELYNHFNEETEKLRTDIEQSISILQKECEEVNNAFLPDENALYFEYRQRLKNLIANFDLFKNEYITELNKLINLIENRKNSLHKEILFDYTYKELSCENIFDEYEELRTQSQQYGKNISLNKKEAQNALRLYEVKNFVDNIDYIEKIKEISTLEKKEKEKKNELDEINEIIVIYEKEIANKKLLIKDEEKGAQKVNEYLNSFLGNRRLSLRTVTFDNNEKYFEVIRDGEKAYHLSEGECRLISFCYFIAKLRDIDTDGKKSIIWIDDPISSLDNNHIFAVYSLIYGEILSKNIYEQFFISTHNLLFMKYLRYFPIKKNKFVHLVIERFGDNSDIKIMPNYLKEHGTEFNTWFKYIYFCSKQHGVTDDNLYLFESFGNFARKFLEIYLFYKYPDEDTLENHLYKFFNSDEIPSIFVRKITNEESHSGGNLENYEISNDVPEIIDAAKKIVERLKVIDKDQFESLVLSIKSEDK